VDADLVSGLVDGAERDRPEGGEGGVVVAGDGDVAGYGQAGLGDRVEHAHGDDVGTREDGRGPAGAGQQLPGADVAAVGSSYTFQTG
jgi:hypothetical protein